MAHLIASPSALRLLPLSLAEWRAHPWRQAAVLLTLALGVALAWSVHLVNESALGEFASAVRQTNGQPDATLRAQREGFDDALFERLAAQPEVLAASPVVEVDTYARSAPGATGASNARVAVRVLGVDALRLPALASTLLPLPAAGSSRTAALNPGAVFANASAMAQLGLKDNQPVELQVGMQWLSLALAGRVAADGAPLLVMDIAGAQGAFGWLGRISRIDLRLQPGTDLSALLLRVQAPPAVRATAPEEDTQRVSNLSRAYRVNLTVLALVALLVGAFMVYSVVALSVAQRLPGFALLGVLGLAAAQRRALVLWECALLGLAGSLLGLLFGFGLAWAALQWLAGDLGGGYFPGVQPRLQVQPMAALVFGLLGVIAALVGGWVPARQAEGIAPAQALKGAGLAGGAQAHPGLAGGLLALGAGLALLPPIAGLPLAAYASVAALLFGGVAAVPWVVQALLATAPKPQGALPLLALQRARHQRHTATAAVAGVVASLALSVALTVMVGSFRQAVSQWLEQILPADLYARTAGSSAQADQAFVTPEFVRQAASLPGVARVQAGRVRSLQLASGLPAVALLARDLNDAATELPLVAPPLAPRAGELGVYVSEAMVSLHGARPGSVLNLPLGATPMHPSTHTPTHTHTPVRVLGVWRDYARQFGTVLIDARAYRTLTGDTRVNELALWLQPGASAAQVQEQLLAASGGPLLEFATTAQLRSTSLRIFDRSFAVTTYLQAVAIGIGLVGVGMSLSAQVLARKREFGLLAHLGLTRRQVLAVVLGEMAAWLAAGTLAGLALGLALSVVLVHVVNPQSFHWTMELAVPWFRLAALCAAVLATGLVTSALAARGATAGSAVRAVREEA